jgi:predicted MFS family arabinose efflux permease
MVLGISQSFSSLGRILGPVLGGFIYSNVAISAPFMMASLIGISALIIVSFIFRNIPMSGKKGST